MPKILLDVKNGEIISIGTSGMKAAPISKMEKLRRAMTRERSLGLRNKWDRLNTPIVYPKI